MNLRSIACFQNELGRASGGRPQWTDHRIWSALTVVLLLGWAVVICTTFQSYGITFDEDGRSTYGDYILRWYTSGFKDTNALTYYSYWPQPELFSVVERMARRISPFGGFETSHLLNAFFGLAAVWGAFRLGNLVGGRFAGFLAAVFLLLTPAFYGHSFNNPVDIPATAFTALVIYYLLLALRELPRVSTKLVWKIGIATGLALGVRVGSILLIGYIGLGFLLWYGFEVIRQGTSDKQQWLRRLWNRPVALRLAGTLALICAIAYAVMLLWWPAAQLHPIYQPAKGLWFATHYNSTWNIFFEGRWISNHHLPWYYLAKSFLIVLPEFYFLALAATALVFAVRRRGSNIDFLSMVVLLVSAFFPVVYTIVARPPEYDGMRHYLFILPAVAAVCGIGVAQLLEWRPRVAVPVLALILCSVAITASDMWELHPHQYVYFNRMFGGGLSKASQSFETDYWGNTYKEGVDWLVRNYKPRSTDTKVKVASCSYSLSTSYFLPQDRFEYIGSYEKGQLVSGEPDVFLATTRWNCDQKVQGKVIHIVERQNTPLLFIKEVPHEAATPMVARAR